MEIRLLLCIINPIMKILNNDIPCVFVGSPLSQQRLTIMTLVLTGWVQIQVYTVTLQHEIYSRNVRCLKNHKSANWTTQSENIIWDIIELYKVHNKEENECSFKRAMTYSTREISQRIRPAGVGFLVRRELTGSIRTFSNVSDWIKHKMGRTSG